MQMGGMENESQFPASIGKHAEKRDGVGTTGEAYCQAHAGLEERGVEWQSGRRRAHERMIRRSLYSTHADDAQSYR